MSLTFNDQVFFIYSSFQHYTLYCENGTGLVLLFLSTKQAQTVFSHCSLSVLSSQDNEKRTPLHAAAYLGDAEIIELLILSGKIRPENNFHKESVKGKHAPIMNPCHSCRADRLYLKHLIINIECLQSSNESETSIRKHLPASGIC